MPTQIATRVDDATYADFDNLAARHGRSVASENRMAIEAWIAKHRKDLREEHDESKPRSRTRVRVS